MRCKLKTFLGFYQCVAAVPSVLGMALPDNFTHLRSLYSLLELPNFLGIDLLLPVACYGSYRRRLLFSALWPFALALLLLGGSLARDVVRFSIRMPHGVRRTLREVLRTRLQASLPLALVLTFALLPSISSRIFKTFLCQRFRRSDGLDGDEPAYVEYLRDDYSLSCSSDEYRVAQFNALVLCLGRKATLPDKAQPIPCFCCRKCTSPITGSPLLPPFLQSGRSAYLLSTACYFGEVASRYCRVPPLSCRQRPSSYGVSEKVESSSRSYTA